MVVVDSSTFSSILCDKLGVVTWEHISVTVKLCVANVVYKEGQYIMISATSESDNLIFGKIINFVSCSHSTDWYTVIETLKTVDFWAHFHTCGAELYLSCGNLLSQYREAYRLSSLLASASSYWLPVGPAGPVRQRVSSLLLSCLLGD